MEKQYIKCHMYWYLAIFYSVFIQYLISVSFVSYLGPVKETVNNTVN